MHTLDCNMVYLVEYASAETGAFRQNLGWSCTQDDGGFVRQIYCNSRYIAPAVPPPMNSDAFTGAVAWTFALYVICYHLIYLLRIVD